jgi:copper transport protein
MKSTPFAKWVSALFLGLSCLFLAATAHAHAEFRGSLPVQDSLLDALPAEVRLEFSEQVGVLALTWRLPDGRGVEALGETGATSLTVPPPPEAGRGTYVLRWRVASADGHPVAGSLVFSVGEVTGAAPDTAERSAFVTVALRAVMVMALVLSVGAAVFTASVAPVSAGMARMALGMAVLVLPFGLLWLGAEGMDRLGLPVSALAQGAVWTEAIRSPVLYTVLLAASAAALAAAALLTGSRMAALAALGLAALSFPASGHALSAPTPLALPLTALHGGAMLFWVGALIPLAAALTPLDASARAALLRRFSRPAVAAVLVLIGSGLGLILIRPLQMDTLSTPWARLLGAKLALVAVMLALAVWHRARAVPMLASKHAAPVRRTVRAEAALGLIVLCLAMGFRLAPPPTAPMADPPRVHIHTTKAMADVVLSASPPGAVTIDLFLADGDFGPLDPQEVRLALTDPAAGIGPLTVQANRQEPGHWTTPPLTLPSPGPWQVKLVLLVTDFEQVTLSGELVTEGQTE